MSLKPKTRLRWAIFVAILVGVVIVLPGVPNACNWLKDNLWGIRTGTVDWGDISIECVYEGDTFLYAFAYTNNISMATPGVSGAHPSDKGIFWDKNQRDGLWVNAKKFSIPAGFKVVAIRDDGTVAPIEATQADVNRLWTGGNPELHGRIVAAIEPPADGNASTRPGQ